MPVLKGLGILLVVGTKKGLFILRSSRRRERWRLAGPFLPGEEVNHAVLDPRSGVIYAAATSPWFGPRVYLSPDLGQSWRAAKASPQFPPEAGLTVERLWHIEPGRQAEPGTLYCGIAPAALFRSDDAGETWAEVQGLSSHPSRGQWQPGAGGLCLHSIVLDPFHADRMWVGISAAGNFRSDDGGKSWRPLNKSLRAEFMPERFPEVGQCIHHLVRAAGRQPRLYAQTHCGVYRSDDGAESWTEITTGLPSDFGMVMAAHPRSPGVAYVVPLKGAELRCPPEGKLRVFRTRDAGRTWQPLAKGLPQRNAFMGTYREALCLDALEPPGVYLATNTGQLYASVDEGESWRRLTGDLPPVSSVSAATLE